jgi:hypothetical protein
MELLASRSTQNLVYHSLSAVPEYLHVRYMGSYCPCLDDVSFILDPTCAFPNLHLISPVIRHLIAGGIHFSSIESGLAWAVSSQIIESNGFPFLLNFQTTSFIFRFHIFSLVVITVIFLDQQLKAL